MPRIACQLNADWLHNLQAGGASGTSTPRHKASISGPCLKQIQCENTMEIAPESPPTQRQSGRNRLANNEDTGHVLRPSPAVLILPMQSPLSPTSCLGQGIHRVADQLDDPPAVLTTRRSAVEGEALAGEVGANSHCSVCRTASELAQAMQVQQGGSLTGLGLLPLLSAKREFLNSLKTTVYSVSVVVHTWRIITTATLSTPRLRDDVPVPRSEDELDQFVRIHGDSYISAIGLGGEFLGVYTFRSETHDQADKVSNALAAGGLMNGFRLGIELHRTLETVSQQSSIRYDVDYRVRGTAAVPKLDPADLVAYAESFGSTGFDQPALLQLRSQGYEKVPEIGLAFQPVAANRELFTRSGGLLRQRQRIVELINQIQDTKECLRIYGIQLAEAGDLEANRQKAQGDLDTLEALSRAYQSSPSAPLDPPQLPSLDLGSPHLVTTVREDPATLAGHIEAPNGQAFEFPFDLSTAVQRRVRLCGVAMEAGWRIDKLTLRYKSHEAAAEAVVRHGGDDGLLQGTKSLGEGESITAIASEFGPKNIDRLSLRNGDTWTLTGGGEKGDKQHPLNWQRAANQVVLGFTGRSDDDKHGALYALQAVVAEFERLMWEHIDPSELLDPGDNSAVG